MNPYHIMSQGYNNEYNRFCILKAQSKRKENFKQAIVIVMIGIPYMAVLNGVPEISDTPPTAGIDQYCTTEGRLCDSAEKATHLPWFLRTACSQDIPVAPLPLGVWPPCSEKASSHEEGLSPMPRHHMCTRGKACRLFQSLSFPTWDPQAFRN